MVVAVVIFQLGRKTRREDEGKPRGTMVFHDTLSPYSWGGRGPSMSCTISFFPHCCM